MKKQGAFLAAVLLLALLTACLGQTGQEEDGLRLWFVAPGEEQSRQVASALGSCGYQGPETVSAILRALMAGPPDDSDLTTVIPKDTQVVGWSMEGRVVHVELSDAYGSLSGLDLTLADYCITLTLCQLSGVDGVRITVDSGGAAFQDRRVLRAGDVIFSGAEEEPVDVPATLYFRRTGGSALAGELRVFRLTEDEVPAKAVLEALIAGPQDEGLAKLLPQDLAVRSAWVDDGVCSVDLSAELYQGMPERPEEQELAISSIVETLCSLDTVERVQLLVEGEPVTIYGSIELSGPLTPGQVPDGRAALIGQIE